MKVDKSKWKKLQLKDIGKIISGATPRTDNPANWEGGNLNWVTPAELNGSKYYGETIKKITSEAALHSNVTLMPAGTVLLSSRAPIGKVAITTVPMYCNQGFKNIVCDETIIYNEYLYYYLISSNAELNRRGSGATFKEISKKVVESFPVLLPTLDEQKGIVSELDRIQGMIDGYKTQITDLDALAQSLFLDTFGDPVTNPKGWEKKNFGSSFKLKSGDSLSAKQMDSGPYPVYGGNGVNGSHSQFNKDGSIIIIGRVGVYCGNVRLVKGKFWLTDNAFELIELQEKYNQTFLCYLLMLLNLNEKANQAAQPVISNAVLKDISVILPPLALQELFAARVKTIEALKGKLRKQVADCELLMAERMQYYFI